MISSAPFTVTVIAPPSTAIGQLAQQMAPGESRTDLGDSGLSSGAWYTVQWCNRFHYDHAHSRAHLLGKLAAGQGGDRSNCLYDAVTNTWQFAMYGGSELGHVYESIAYNPLAGELFTGNWPGGLDEQLKKWTVGQPLDQWLNPATNSFGAHINSSTQPSLCWHPNLFGPGDGGILALKDEAYGDDTVIAWRRSDDSWHTVPGTAHPLSGSYQSNGAIEYVRASDVCLASFNPGQGGRTFRIPAGSGGALAAATQIADVPIHCGYTGAGGQRGILIDDPAGGPSLYILEKGGTNRVWRLEGESWSLRSYTHPFPTGSATDDTNWVVASCFPLGVFWCQDNWETTPSRLWRPNG